MASRTIENYLKQLYLDQQDAPGKPVAMGRLATLMAVAPGTVTAMVKVLAESGLARYEPRTGVRLTAQGTRLALHVLRRHRLVELFLVKVVGLDWSEVHDEAEEWEHVISDKVLARIDALLGHPTTDPHGDPIPTATGRIAGRQTVSFATCALDEALQIAQVLDQEPGFLQFVRQRGLVPGATVRVAGRDAQADAVSVRLGDGAVVTLSTGAARKFLVKAAEPSTMEAAGNR